MTNPRTPVIDAVRTIARPGFLDEPGASDALHSFLDAAGAPRELTIDGLTVRMLTEILHHEAIVLEAYKDSVGVWTWGVGVTSKSGHMVERYKDNPQPIERCLGIYIWLLRTKYLPEVRRAFGGRALTEAQLTAALSFHWNTGAIGSADWVELWLAGDVAGARLRFMDWKRPASIIPRREAERDLFFASRWAGTGLTTIWPVRKPSYSPNWAKPQRVDVRDDLARAIAT
jgi:lysozyme